MKTQQVNLRLEADLIAALERAAKEEALDRGTMLRKLLLEALDRRRLECTLELYQRGEISLGRASEETRLTQWELLELARSRRIAYPLTPDEAEVRLTRWTGHASRVAEPGGRYSASAARRAGAPTLPDYAPKRGGVLLIGVNPALPSARAGHYYQGRLGKRLWRRLVRVGLLANANPGREDEAFVTAGHGLTDVVKRPTRAASEVGRAELERGAEELRARIREWSPRLVLFAFKAAAQAALGSRRVAPGPCEPLEGVPTFLLSSPYAPAPEAQRLDAQLIDALGGSTSGSDHLASTQPVTATDIAHGRIRLTKEAEPHFPGARAELDVILRGERVRALYDPRSGPRRKRSAVLSVGKAALSRLVRPGECLHVRRGDDGLVRLD